MLNLSFKRSRVSLAAALVFGLAGAASAQDLSTDLVARRATVTAARPGLPLSAASKAAPAAIVQAFLRSRGVEEAALASLQAAEAGDVRNGISHVRLEQRVGGLTVYGSYVKAAINSRGELVHLIDRLAKVTAARPSLPAIDAAQALAAAMTRVHPGVRAGFTPLGRVGNTASFAGGAFFHTDPTVTTVAVARRGDRLETAYLVQTWSEARNLLNHTLVSGSGQVLSVELRTASDAYNVFVEDPGKGPQAVVNGPAPGGVESPQGWLASGAQKTTKIVGNNVEAHLDVDANNRPDRGGTRVKTGSFVTAANLAVAPSTDANRAVSVQNLFYLNNVIHDRLYDLGFTEAAGNFQTDNLGRGGAGADAVQADAQDGSGTDNANFSTPVDGKKPRMQMYLWTGAGPTDQVHVNAPAPADFFASPAQFGPALSTSGVTGNVKLTNDGTGTTSDACEAIVGSLTGQIALLDRGTCAFTVKVKNVQNAGAVGALVVNNTGTNETFVMGGTDATITIPALMVGVADGTTLRNTAGLNLTLRALPVQPLQIDASLDADVVFHEYGHGLSWRLVGGMSGPLAGAIGEGASDGLAMLMDGDDIMGEYSSSNPAGIRRYPYAGYPLTYANVTGAEVHNDGEIYAAIVWRLIELFGPAGHDTWFGYFVDGMKYTPSTPAYEDMRNGILDSISAAGAPVAHCGLVWQAFAQFGVGDGAKGIVNADNTVSITPSSVARTDCSH